VSTGTLPKHRPRPGSAGVPSSTFLAVVLVFEGAGWLNPRRELRAEPPRGPRLHQLPHGFHWRVQVLPARVGATHGQRGAKRV